MELAVLLRNCPHDGNATGSTIEGSKKRLRYALKCDTFTVQFSKSPMQLAMLGQSPELIDLNIFRPSITITGIVDTVGQTNSTTPDFQNMESITVGRRYWNGVKYENVNQTYYIPFKNALEGAVATWIHTETTPLELEIGNADFPLYSTAAEANSSDSVSVYTSLLNGALNDSSTTLTVDDADEFTAGDIIRIVNSGSTTAFEELLLSDVNTSTNVLTATRGYNSTAAAAHDDNAAITRADDETGGGVYLVAIQQARFKISPGTEDRYEFTMQFVSEARKDSQFNV